MAFEALLADGKVGLVSMTHMSNVLGTYTPAERIVRMAHAHGAKVLFDGAQAVVHRRVDVQALDCDFYVVHWPQAVRADRHRRAVGAARTARDGCRRSWAVAK